VPGDQASALASVGEFYPATPGPLRCCTLSPGAYEQPGGGENSDVGGRRVTPVLARGAMR